MPSIYGLKPRFQKLLRPFTVWLARTGVTANQVTIAAIFLSALGGGMLLADPKDLRRQVMIPFILLIRMALNAVDGMLAREHQMKSRLGAVLNEIGDVLSDSVLYLPVALIPGVHSPLVVLSVVLALISEMTGVVAVQIGSSRRYDGPMGKSDRAFVIGLFCLLSGCGADPAGWSHWIFGIVCALLCVTIWNRAAHALKEVPRYDSN